MPIRYHYKHALHRLIQADIPTANIIIKSRKTDFKKCSSKLEMLLFYSKWGLYKCTSKRTHIKDTFQNSPNSKMYVLSFSLTI